MLQNALMATLRHVSRSRWFVFVNVLGLSIGLTSSLLIYCLVANLSSFDRFLPDYQHIALVTMTSGQPGQAPQSLQHVPDTLAPLLKADFPEIEDAVRLASGAADLQVGELKFHDDVSWVDPTFFKVIRLAPLAGDPGQAVLQPDGLVITREMARKYFGQDTPLGRAMVVNGKAMVVRAVLRDLPNDTHLRARVFLSGVGAGSPLAGTGGMGGDLNNSWQTANGLVATYVKLGAHASLPSLVAQLPAFVTRRFQLRSGQSLSFGLLPVADVYLRGPEEGGGKPGGNIAAVYMISIIGLLLLIVAASNFVNLMTARSAGRAVEVAVRKAFGAQRRHLFWQFIGEAAIYTAISMVVAVAATQTFLPYVDAFTGTDATFNYWSEWPVILFILALFVVLSVLAGGYPAFVISAFRPGVVLKSGGGRAAGSDLLRQILVMLQFAILIGLSVCAVVINAQTWFALARADRLSNANVLVVRSQCADGFAREVRDIPGVVSATCSGSAPVSEGRNVMVTATGQTRPTSVWASVVDDSFFQSYGHPPIAGRVFSKDQPGDSTGPLPDGRFVGPVVLNEAAVKALGWRSATQAIGQSIAWTDRPGESQVVGVVADFPVGRVTDLIRPTVYYVDPNSFSLLSLKLDDRRVPQTVVAIRQLWRQLSGGQTPMSSFFLADYSHLAYLAIVREDQLLAAFAIITLIVSCLGLYGLATHSVERQTRDIGVRKSFGATTTRIVRYLLWQFTKPVLWANLLAWPLSYFFLASWLQGFSDHIRLSWWYFVAISAAGVLVAWATVSVKTYGVAKAKPVVALRYE